MNSTPPVRPKQPRQKDDCSPITVAVHFAWPLKYPLLVDAKAADHPATLRVLAAGLQMTLSEAGILANGEHGSQKVTFFGDLTEGLIQYATSNQMRAVELTKEFLEHCGLLGECVEIATDDGEGLFRLQYATKHTGPFELYYDDLHVAVRQAIMDRFFVRWEEAIKSIAPDAPQQ